ncbi:protein kinase [Planctomonas sp. JC2975]|uniref:protein kinase domain-containing protein n=1 Tax=Planctomonas sp. JC2975 TaxID=2729626 RepID=UPI0014754240|nr:protein kinase [Planctomonas sp. JC2975]NNC10664.1 protein kinase [Planctomonas sp. JC2975]
MSRRTQPRTQRHARRRDPHPAAGDASAPATVRTQVGGYRLLRTLGSGTRSVCYLATGDDGQVVVKMRRNSDDSALDDASAEECHEVECLSALDDPHVVRILDVAVGADHPSCVVLERLDGPSLASWLRDRDFIDVAEAVTIGVSIVRAVAAVHRSGWTHGAVTATNILFDAAGCPVLIGFGGALRSTGQRMSADWGAAATVIESVVVGSEGATDAAIANVRGGLRALMAADSGERTAIANAEEALFALGPAGPVSTGRARSAEAGDRTVVPGVDRRRQSTAPTSAEGRESAAWRHGSHLVAAAMEQGIGAVLSDPLRRLLHGRRRAVVVGIGAAAALTALALFAMPGPPAGNAQTSAPTMAPAGTADSRAAPTPSARTSAGTTSARTGSPSTSTPPASASRESSPDDDPVKAAAALLKRRSTCFARSESGCLADVDQEGSPLLEADIALMARGGRPTDTPTEARLSLIESMGATSVIAVAPDDAETTKPASLLVIRTEAGWRLRAFFED